mmetsp:Transcript_4382/g.15487  ORF Transcript_4382/g.15487 Transcript_4382/m.15487 type:complete len:231 (+) Transcript_4382:2668-3360(+)
MSSSIFLFVSSLLPPPFPPPNALSDAFFKLLLAAVACIAAAGTFFVPSLPPNECAAFFCFFSAYRFVITSLMCVCNAMQMSSPCFVSNWKMCNTPATRILKNTAAAEEPNCMMSRSSALWRYSIGTGRKKWIPRLLMPRTILPGSKPIGSSIRFTGKKIEPPYGSARIIVRRPSRASSLLWFNRSLCLDMTTAASSSRGALDKTARGKNLPSAFASSSTSRIAFPSSAWI